METRAAYDEIAQWYEDWLGDGTDADGDRFYEPARRLMGNVAGLRICDLACGQGRVARSLAAEGAHVLGVDASGEMLAIGQRYDNAGIDYVQGSAHTLEALSDNDFDGVVCNMALMDIPDLDATVRSVRRVLRTGGWFVFSTLHPCFNAPISSELSGANGRLPRAVADYFSEGHWKSDQRAGPPGRVGAYHRTLTTYINTLLSTGFAIEQIDEVLGGSGCWREVPPVLVLRCRKR